MIFPIEDNQSTLSYKFFSSKTNQFIGATDVPLCDKKTENEKVSQDFKIKDDNDEDIDILRPKITLITSFK